MELSLAVACLACVRELGEDVLAGRLEAVLVGIDVVGGAEPLVRDGAVVALEVVLAADLPVRGELVFVARVEDEVVDRDELGDRAEGLGERRRVCVGVDEAERPPRLEAQRDEREPVRLEALLPLGARRGPERAVEPVRPRVVGALDRLSGPVALGEQRAAVATDVEEGANPLLGADDEHRDVARPGGEAIPDALHPSRVADVLPRPPEDVLLLAAQDLRIGVPAPGQCARRGHDANLPAWSQVSGGLGVFSPVNPLTALCLTADEPQPSLRVLVVDDQLLYAEAISVLLDQQEGLEVVGIAGDGREAIKQAAALRPDVVLMDIQMPRLDGISATRRIRRRLPATRVVVMTGLPGDEHAERALGAGADACIKKFSRAGDLVTAIEQLA